MDPKLFNAILAMDAYNRGYNPAINISGSSLGKATILIDSEELGEDAGGRLDQQGLFLRHGIQIIPKTWYTHQRRMGC
jgi:hypothetical protein